MICCKGKKKQHRKSEKLETRIYIGIKATLLRYIHIQGVAISMVQRENMLFP